MAKLKRYLEPYKKYIVGVLLLTFFSVMTELFLPNLMAKIVDEGIISGNTNHIVRTGIIMLSVSILALVSMVFSSYLSAKASMGFSRDIRRDVFTHIENFSLEEFGQVGTASLITRTTNDVNQLQQVFLMSMRMMVRAPLMLFGGLVMAISKNLKLSIILLVSMPLLVISVALIGRMGFPLFKKVQKLVDKLNLVLREKLTGVRVIRAFDKVEYEEERFKKANKDLTETTLKVNRLMFLLLPVVNLVLNFTTIAVVWFGAKQVELGNMMIGDIMAFIQYIMLIMFSLMMFSAIFIVVPRAIASAERINEVMDIEQQIKDKENPKEISEVENLEFEDVSFSYSHRDVKVLKDINFKVEKGETLAIIGGTGSGKSTLINLIPRFYDIDSGSIKLNGVDIRDLKQVDLRSKIGYVPQKATLFSGTIKSNILKGKEDATEEELNRAIRIAQAEEFVEDLEDGYDSYISQGGTNVSGGQKQRISIARAIIREPEIYIFDDSFSALDFKTDAKLRRALKEEIKDSIIIIVAQRVSTVRDADKILVLDDGKIAGFGKHKELLEESPVYRDIVKSQGGEEEIA